MTGLAAEIDCIQSTIALENCAIPHREARILLVDEEPAVQGLVRDCFAGNGFAVTSATSRANASALLAAEVFDLVVLDLRLGRESGLDLLRDLRAKSDIPVIVTSAHRRDVVDRVVGLELGADDYLVKPFGVRELLARVRVVLRRADGGSSGSARPNGHGRHTYFGGWKLDRRLRRLTNPAGEHVPLTKGEYALLVALLDAPQRPLSREQLLQATRVHEDVFDRSIDVQVLRLRRKIEADPRDPKIIVTQRGFGYVFAASVATSEECLQG